MFKNRIRLPLYLGKAQFPTERNVFRKADGSSKVLSVTVKNTLAGTTDYLPEDWHRKLIIALSHDEVNIENNRYLTDVVLESDYAIEWQDFRNYPVAQAKFTIQVTPFNATNSNCQTCEQATQLSLDDDTFAGTLDEDTTEIYPDVTENDSICCYPFTIELTDWNTLYLTSAEITDEGELTIVIKPSVPDGTNILVATYRVTCADGSYDEANVYADFNGTLAGCNSPSNIVFSDITANSATATWPASSPVPASGYIWNLYDLSSPSIVLQTGTTSSLTTPLTGLASGVRYLFEVISNCGGGLTSNPVNNRFTTTGTGYNCGSFTFLFTDESDPATFTFIDCNSNVVTYAVLPGVPKDFCALINSGAEVPYYFSTNAINPLLTYNGLC